MKRALVQKIQRRGLFSPQQKTEARTKSPGSITTPGKQAVNLQQSSHRFACITHNSWAATISLVICEPKHEAIRSRHTKVKLNLQGIGKHAYKRRSNRRQKPRGGTQRAKTQRPRKVQGLPCRTSPDARANSTSKHFDRS